MTNVPTSGGMGPRGTFEAPSQVTEYFSAQAGTYHTRSTRLPWASLRARELNAVHSLVGDISGVDVLELGAGSGFYTREFVRWGARCVWAVDISEAMLATLPGGPIRAVLGDAEAVRLDQRFPVVVASGLIEFVRDPAAVLRNVARHAEVGARFVLLVPRANAFGFLYRRFHRAHGLSIHLFDRKWFETVAPSSGWQVDTTVRVWPFSLAVRLYRT